MSTDYRVIRKATNLPSFGSQLLNAAAEAVTRDLQFDPDNLTLKTAGNAILAKFSGFDTSDQVELGHRGGGPDPAIRALYVTAVDHARDLGEHVGEENDELYEMALPYAPFTAENARDLAERARTACDELDET